MSDQVDTPEERALAEDLLRLCLLMRLPPDATAETLLSAVGPIAWEVLAGADLSFACRCRLLAQGILQHRAPEVWQPHLETLGLAPAGLLLECAQEAWASDLDRALEMFPGGVAALVRPWPGWKPSTRFRQFQMPNGVRLAPGGRPECLRSTQEFALWHTALSDCGEAIYESAKSIGFFQCTGTLRAKRVSALILMLDPDLDLDIHDAQVQRVLRPLGPGRGVIEYAPVEGPIRSEANAFEGYEADPAFSAAYRFRRHVRTSLTHPVGAMVQLTPILGRRCAGRQIHLPNPIRFHLTLSDLLGLRRLPHGFRFASAEACGGIPLNFTVFGCRNLEYLPRGLVVPGDLHLAYCSGLKALPEGLEVGGGLEVFHGTSLRKIGPGLTVGKSMTLTEPHRLYQWEGPATIGGDLSIGCFRCLKALPESLEVKGDLRITLPAPPLPKSLRVHGKVLPVPRNQKGYDIP